MKKGIVVVALVYAWRIGILRFTYTGNFTLALQAMLKQQRHNTEMLDRQTAPVKT
jgi:hypothetical protein